MIIVHTSTMIIVHKCTMIIVHACTMIIVHACTMIIVHACTLIIVHGCTMIIVHACTMIKVHACTMINKSTVLDKTAFPTSKIRCITGKPFKAPPRESIAPKLFLSCSKVVPNERPSDRATERPSVRATERSSDRGSDDRASDRASDRAIDGDYKSSSRNPFDTLTSALCSIFQKLVFLTHFRCIFTVEIESSKQRLK